MYIYIGILFCRFLCNLISIFRMFEYFSNGRRRKKKKKRNEILKLFTLIKLYIVTFVAFKGSGLYLVTKLISEKEQRLIVMTSSFPRNLPPHRVSFVRRARFVEIQDCFQFKRKEEKKKECKKEKKP